MKMGEQEPESTPPVTAYAAREKREGGRDIWAVEMRDARAEPEDEFGLSVVDALSGNRPDLDALAVAVRAHCVEGNPPRLGAGGGALLQEAVSHAFLAGIKGSVEEIIRSLSQSLPGIEGIDRMGEKIRGARVAAEYVRSPLPEGWFRYAALDVDRYHSTDYVEARHTAKGIDAVRLVQVKASRAGALEKASEIYESHRRYVGDAPEAMRRVAEAEALHDLMSEGGEAPVGERIRPIVEVARLIAAGASVSPELVRAAAPLHEYARLYDSPAGLARTLGLATVDVDRLLAWAAQVRLPWVAANRLVAAKHPNVLFAPMKPPSFTSVVVAGEWSGGQLQQLVPFPERPLDLGRARGLDAKGLAA